MKTSKMNTQCLAYFSITNNAMNFRYSKCNTVEQFRKWNYCASVYQKGFCNFSILIYIILTSPFREGIYQSNCQNLHMHLADLISFDNIHHHFNCMWLFQCCIPFGDSYMKILPLIFPHIYLVSIFLFICKCQFCFFIV